MGIFGNTFNGWHLLIILIVVLLIWGSTKLPALAESLGKSAKILKREMKNDDAATAAPGAASPETPTTHTSNDQR